MRVLTLTYEEKYKLIKCSFDRNIEFTQHLKYRIKASHRRYDSEDKCWYVKEVAITTLVRLGDTYFDRIVYKELPVYLQIKIADRKNIQLSKAVSGQTAYQVLHLQESAPLEVVKAAYKALAHIHHPDKGGETEMFTQINEAYEKICEEK